MIEAIIGVLQAVVLLAYPLAVYFGLSHFNARGVGLLVLVLLAPGLLRTVVRRLVPIGRASSVTVTAGLARGKYRYVVAARDTAMAQDYFDQIAELCRINNIRFCDRNTGFSIQTDYALAVAWRWLIDASPARLIVLHDSLLPRYRGFNPLVTALIKGDAEIGVTALYATAEYDLGDIIAQSSSAISYPIRIQEAIKTVVGHYEALVTNIAGILMRGEEPMAKPQDEADASYSLWRDDEDYFVDWSHSAIEIKRFINAVGYPYKEPPQRWQERLFGSGTPKRWTMCA